MECKVLKFVVASLVLVLTGLVGKSLFVKVECCEPAALGSVMAGAEFMVLLSALMLTRG